MSTYTHQMLDPAGAFSAGSVEVGADDVAVGAGDVVVGPRDAVVDPGLTDVRGAVDVVGVWADVEVTGAVVVVEDDVTFTVVVVDIAARAARAAASALARTWGSPY